MGMSGETSSLTVGVLTVGSASLTYVSGTLCYPCLRNGQLEDGGRYRIRILV